MISSVLVETFTDDAYHRPARLKVAITEHELIAGLLSGEQKAIAALYDNYSAALYGIIFRIVRTDEIAEDILQDTFVKIWRNIHQYDSTKGRLFTWLAQTARNLAIDQQRSKYHRNNKDNGRIDDLRPQLEIVYNASKNADVIGIKALTAALPVEHHSIVDLIYFQGYTHVEAAEHLRIPVGTLKSRLRQAIRQLRSLFN